MDRKKAQALLKNETELRRAAEIAFKILDVDRNGWLSKVEVESAFINFLFRKGVQPSRTEIDSLFARLDRNKDGRVSFKDFFITTKEILSKKY